MTTTPDAVVLIHGLWMTPRSRPHFIAGEPGREEVADFALSWATENARTSAAVHA